MAAPSAGNRPPSLAVTVSLTAGTDHINTGGIMLDAALSILCTLALLALVFCLVLLMLAPVEPVAVAAAGLVGLVVVLAAALADREVIR